jgi:hypothetical protein
MSQSIRMSLGYKLRSGEDAKAVAARFGAEAKDVRSLANGVVELPIAIDGQASGSDADDKVLAAQFKDATVKASVSHGIRTVRVENDEETFDVTQRGGRVFVTTFDGFGGVAERGNGAFDAAFKSAYDAYRAVLVDRKL